MKLDHRKVHKILEITAKEVDEIKPEKEAPDVFDKIGQKVEIGSIIVYGHALGRCAALQLGKVLALKVIPKTSRRWKGRDPVTQENVYEDYDTADYRISVQGVEMNDNWSPDDEPSLLRKGTLQFPSRMIVLDPKLVPEKIRELLDNAGK
jgi:hypothetical protein